MLTKPTIAAILALLVSPPALAEDRAAAARLAAEWRQAPDVPGEIVELSAGDAGFIGIFHPHATPEAKGAVILLHDQRTNADSDEVIRPLRTGLASHGWETLSLQLPAAYAHQSVDDWQRTDEPVRSRLLAAVEWLDQREQLNQVVLTLGATANVALRAIAEENPANVRACVLISVPGGLDGARDKAALDTLARPVLDIFAERDHRAVTDGAEARRQAARNGADVAYFQYRLPGAGSGFGGTESLLLARVRAWLSAHAAAPEGN